MRGGAGPSSRHHPLTVRGTTGAFEHATAVTLADVPRDRASDSSFWFLLFRAHVWKGSKLGGSADGVDQVYGVLLPYLNSRPFLSNHGRNAIRWVPRMHSEGAASSQVVHVAIGCMLDAALSSAHDASRLLVLLEWTYLRIAHADLAHLEAAHANAVSSAICAGEEAHRSGPADVAPSDLTVLDVAAQQLAAHAAAASPPLGEAPLDGIMHTVTALKERTRALRGQSADDDVEVPASRYCEAGACYPFVGRLRRDVDVEHLAGTPPPPPIQLPIELTRVPSSVDSFDDIAHALRECAGLCALLANQAHYFRNRNATHLRLALVQHTVTELIPLPMARVGHTARPSRHSDGTPTGLRRFSSAQLCVWQRGEIRHETQAELMRQLRRVARDYVAASLSLPADAHADAARVIVLGCIASIADAVMLSRVTDDASVFSTHYRGLAGGPTLPFGFGLGTFASESEAAPMVGAALAAARAQLLEYFSERLAALDDGHVLFQFERSMKLSDADGALLKQLCLVTGTPHANLPHLAAGVDPALTDACPELGALRDIVYYAKMLMAPSVDALPAVQPWAPLQASLSWSVDDDGVLQVGAFGARALHCCPYATRSRVGRGSRRSPSLASAAHLLGGSASDTLTEDDVLHVREMPNFGNRLRARDAELLLQYLLVPYLRIPLLVRFLADRGRLQALMAPQLQAVLDAAVFEPGPWRSPASLGVTEVVPCTDRTTLATPAGLLVQELRYAPAPFVASLEQMIEAALEMDVGKYSPSSSPVVLYVARLVARVEGYVQMVLSPPERMPKPIADLTDNEATLRDGWARIRAVMKGRAVPMLHRWCVRAVAERQLGVACGLHAHLALLHKNADGDDLDETTVFININWGDNAAAEVRRHCERRPTRIGGHLPLHTLKEDSAGHGSSALPTSFAGIYGVLEHELFAAFQRLRWPVIEWLRSHPAKCNKLMESIVRTITFTDDQSSSVLNEPGVGPAAALRARHWTCLEGPGRFGRFVPDTELGALDVAEAAKAAAASYEEYLRAETQSADTEMDVQVGEYTLKKNRLRSLPPEISTQADFVTVFGVSHNLNPIQCVEVQTTPRRTWLRLVGQRHDVQLWDADERTPEIPYVRAYQGVSGRNSNVIPAGLASGEQWISRVLEPFRKQYLRECELFLPEWDHSKQTFATLAGVARPPADGAGPPPPRVLKEVVVFREWKVVHVYNVVSHARRFYRTLVFSSDAAFCLYDMPCTLFLEGTRPRLIAGDPRKAEPRSSSLLITRNLTTALGQQVYVPGRLLHGLVPAVLLEAYAFWQNEDGSLAGYAHSHAPLAVRSTRLHLQMFPLGDADTEGYGRAQASLVVRRVPLLAEGDERSCRRDDKSAEKSADETAEGASDAAALEQHTWRSALAPLDSNRPTHTLLNLLHAGAGSTLAQLARPLLRVENLSHVLVWTSAADAGPVDDVPIDLVELPRLRLSFTVEEHRGKMRLASVEHSGLYLAPTTSLDERTRSLLRGLPNSLLLENNVGERWCLLSATTLPARPALEAALFSTEVVLDRSNKKWLSNVGNAPAYVYAVHVGKLALTPPTFAAGLYLLLMRFLGRQYAEVFRMAPCAVSDVPLSPDEAQIFECLGSLSHDVHPDAHACRLKIALETRGTAHGAAAASRMWVLRDEYAAYARKFDAVSALCRLSVADEAHLLTMVDTDDSADLVNRRTLVRALVARISGDPVPPISLRYPPYANAPPVDPIDAPSGQVYVGESDLSGGGDSWLSRFATLSYSRPDETSSVSAVTHIHKWLDGGLSLSGGKHSLGFLFLYELMTGSLSLRILPTDSPHALGSLLLRALPQKEMRPKDQLLGILRLLAHHPAVAAKMPKFHDTRKFKVSKKVLKSSEMLKTLFLGAREGLRDAHDTLRWPAQRPLLRPLTILNVPEYGDFLSEQRTWLSAHALHDYARAHRTLKPVSVGAVTYSASEIAEFAGAPLASSTLVKFTRPVPPARRSAGGGAIADLLPELAKHGLAAHPLAASTLSRLRDDLGAYAEIARDRAALELECLTSSGARELAAKPEAAAKAMARVQELVVALAHVQARDGATMLSAMSEAEALANRSGVVHRLAQSAGAEVTVDFGLLVRLLVSAQGDTSLRWLNPSLSDGDLAEIDALVTCAMLTVTRIGHAHRCLAVAHKLIELLVKLGSPSREGGAALEEACTALAQRGGVLASLIGAKRCYVATPGYGFDPRLLAFEYAFDLLLRQQQVGLVLDFLAAAEKGESRVHQLIMGAGKTTVVAPLLALILGNNQTLVMQVVPPSLLEFSRSVMRKRFSTILQKPVYTFTFDRFTAASPELLSKILQARQLSAVVISSPTALKSFVLKFVEVVHLLELAANSEEEDYMRGHQRGLFARGVRRIGELKRTASESAVARGAAVVPQLAAQARVAVNVIRQLQASVLMLDEVDLILHPLKSELNWPLGKRKPLDFGASRWAVPFHLLDALFYCCGGKVPETWQDNGSAVALLERLHEIAAVGFERKVLQRTPHFILLTRTFYHSQLKPLLCRWMLLWLRKARLRHIKDELALAYLMHGPRAHAETTSVVRHALPDEFVKMLNLSHAWLDQLLPHVISKINRVNYGLLSAEQMRKKELPTSRKLLAVPFVGKDVPSPASEFAHPDVVIGFTILAYRYEGMRRSDFKKVVADLVDQLDLQAGPMEKRQAWTTFTKWVERAGGHVRGTKRGPNAPSAESRYGEVWPLHLVDVALHEQISLLLELLCRLPLIIEHYLSAFVFPQTMLHQTMKLSTNAQDLGGELLFKTRLGFSGTPSDLLPLELGRCHYAAGDDAKMLHILSSVENVTYLPLPLDWSVRSLLDEIGSARPPYNALIDTGALVTGMTNLQVAETLLRTGLAEFDAVVFLDALDRKMALLRAGFKVVELAECGVALERRFSFFDQVHTTGMDIEQLLNAHAVLTLGKDMTFRDYAQGAFRLRQIGQGQRLTLFIIPEVTQLIGSHMARCKGLSVAGYSQWFCTLSADAQWRQMLRDVVAWLLLNSMAIERTQFKLLCEQNLAAVWRKRAFLNLLGQWEGINPHIRPEGGASGGEGGEGNLVEDVLKPSIGVFREGVDFSVENTVPEGRDYLRELTQRAADNHELCSGKEERAAVTHVLGQVSEADFGGLGKAAAAKSGAPPPAPRRVRARVLFEYVPTYEGDLHLEEGAEVVVKSQGADGWWEGELVKTGAASVAKAGRFPGNYVAVLEEDAHAAALSVDARVEEGEEAFDGQQEQEAEEQQEQEEEQQKEQQVEQEQEQEIEPPEEAARQKYARDEEGPMPWPLSALERPPEGGAHGFYAWSEFRVHAPSSGRARRGSWTQNDEPPPTTTASLAFPRCMQLTANFSRPAHAEKPRRLKNIAVAIEWRPFGQTATPIPPAPIGQDAVAQLRHVYEICGGDAAGIVASQVWQLWQEMDLNTDDAEEADRLRRALTDAHVDDRPDAPVSFEQLCALMDPAVLQPEVGGRYFVTLSLAEAESLRAVLHARHARPLSSSGAAVTLALHVLSGADSACGSRVLDASLNHVSPSADADPELATVRQCFRFINSETTYSPAEQMLLLRGLQRNAPHPRETFFAAACAARRRVQLGWAGTPLARVFSITHEFAVLRQHAAMGRIRALLAARGLYTLDAFRAFNASQNGLLTCSELFGGLTWLGLSVGPPDVYEMMRHMDKDGDGLASFDEFRQAFGSAQDTDVWAQDLSAAPPVSVDLSKLVPIQIAELADIDQAAAHDDHEPDVPRSVLRQIKLKLQKLEKFDELWRSSGIATKNKVSIWAGRLGTKRLQRNRLRVCFGHFGSGSYSAPRTDKWILELTDNSVGMMTHSKWLPLVARLVAPHPARFHRVWSVQTGTRPIFFWQPVPPSDEYVALGMIATDTEEPPSPRCVHCVPREWVDPAPHLSRMLWSDAGASGKMGCVWSVGSLQLLGAGIGQESPTQVAYALRATRFTLADWHGPSSRVTNMTETQTTGSGGPSCRRTDFSEYDRRTDYDGPSLSFAQRSVQQAHQREEQAAITPRVAAQEILARKSVAKPPPPSY